jgi:hypothetical protein
MSKINEGGMATMLQYEWKYIEEGGMRFKAYPTTEGIDNIMHNYRIFETLQIKASAQKKENTIESLKCFNLEHLGH